jgi:hypothetical protein
VNATIVAVGLAIMTVLLVTTGRRIFKNLYVDKIQAISGKIDKEQIFDPTNIKLNH